MAMELSGFVQHDATSIFQKVLNALLQVTNNNVRFQIAQNQAVQFSTNPLQGASQTDTVVVLSPSLPNSTITKLLSLMKAKRVAIVFTPKDAYFYKTVVIVGNDFSDNDILQFASTLPPNTLKPPIRGTPSEMKSTLETVLG